MKAKDITLSALLIALALALSYFERFIPLNLVVPVPGVKLGLANLVTLFALYRMRPGQAAAILSLRCVLGALFGGGITALAFSLTGGLLALGAMLLGRRAPFLSIYGVSVLGAAGHAVGQILAAMAVLGSGYVLAYLPFLLLTGLVCGLLTATIAARLLRAIPAGENFRFGEK